MSRTKEILYELGIKPNLIGFNYLEFLIDNYSREVNFGDLHKEILTRFNKDKRVSGVVKAMNYAIKKGYERVDEKTLNKYCFITLPTLGEFVATIKDFINNGETSLDTEKSTEQCLVCGAGRDEMDLLYVNESTERPYYICVTCAYKIADRWRRYEAERCQSVFKPYGVF